MSGGLRETVTERLQYASMRNQWKRGLLVAALTVGSSCAARSPVPPPAPAAQIAENAGVAEEAASPHVTSPVVLVTIDGARWQEIFEGSDTSLSHAPFRPSRELVPNLDRLTRERGAAVGAPGRGLRATGPNFVSLPGYTEILTGRAPIGCQDNTCATITAPTFLDEAHASGAKVAAFGSWEMLDRAVSSRPGSFPGRPTSMGTETTTPATSARSPTPTRSSAGSSTPSIT